ncbi:Uncharacterized protein PECH_004558 [Penicillium ucsense]|uniref:Uncharacterized protein n=1 Tax=Penicillium ucsense TaxID=2839758 RepID=A0A8J8VVL1_9EURO|nr:Uncharacterized protein PECM_004099 [Penicillium ucsense]KAF7726554.1 Uncharacterized protein PECH_004558 [Penicillium ucsense]
MAGRTSTRFLYLTVPLGAASAYGTHIGLSHLEAKYPNLSASKYASAALQAPQHPDTQRCAYTDIFAAQIPLTALQKRTRSGTHPTDHVALEGAWARTVLNSRILRVEASVLGLLTKGRFHPGDTGQNGFRDGRDGTTQTLLNGVAYTQRIPGADADSRGLLIAWEMAKPPRVFFEMIARWGYPWRLMSGGRHEMGVSDPYEVPGRGLCVDVRFAGAHDYDIIAVEGENQKVIPAWVMRLHAGYARLILDQAVRELLQ